MQSMNSSTLQTILNWMRTTDIVDLAYKGPGESFELRLEDAILQNPLTPSRLVPVSSPGVGIYHGAAPGRPRTIGEGAAVAAGAELGILETGGKPITLQAPVAGRVAKALIEEGAPAEYGQALFLIAP